MVREPILHLAEGEAGVTVLPGIAALAERYDGFLLDVWGVLHNGVAPYPGVIDALERLNAMGKAICLLSNAPARIPAVMARITGVGIPAPLIANVVSSGEEVWRNLRERRDPFYASLGRRCVWLGPERHNSLLEGQDIERVATLEDDCFLLNAGPDDLDEAATAYRPMLREAAARGIKMVCANADLTVMVGDQVLACAGMLAKRYEEMGGEVRWHGKPHRSVYETATALLGIGDRARILAIGDSLRTDVAGAVGFGIDAALVTGGIHAEELAWPEGGLPDPDRLRSVLALPPFPRWVLPGLRW